ncbi:bis(5'-adenosyl)-triphosphatase enpp4 isoform X1 [Hydra vulgaris]|uniref:bis(5'-adenosyl)-triphosphatase enpp4 isoform X1 n=1 Tax=Hydra vulgaris TaxID=6087 RepID=UPI001F5F7413|nr:bis(5'-adenosyl)-triphosphatase enpp4 [Hydra vulgaris]
MIIILIYLSKILLSEYTFHVDAENVNTKEKLNTTVVIFAFSGLRWDLMKEFDMSGLQELANKGILVSRKTDAFQTESLPSFITMSTGNYPESHGIVSNIMMDLSTKEIFDGTSKKSSWWKDVHPVWIENQLQGKFSALCYWPTHKINFNGSEKVTYSCNNSKYKDPFEELLTGKDNLGFVMPFAERVEQVKKWLNLKVRRPTFIGIYFEEPYFTVSKYGFKSNKTRTIMSEINNLVKNFSLYLSDHNDKDINIIVTGEAGFTELHRSKEIFLDDYLDIPFKIIDNGPITSVFAEDQSTLLILTEKLKRASKHMKLYNGSQLPDTLHFSYLKRTMPIVLVAEEHWRIYPKRIVDNKKVMMGFHGKYQSTHTLFISQGPSFVENLSLESIGNTDIYALVCRVLGIEPRINKSNMTIVNQMLRHVIKYEETKKTHQKNKESIANIKINNQSNKTLNNSQPNSHVGKDSWIKYISKKVTTPFQITITIIFSLLILFGVIYIVICTTFKTMSCFTKKNALVRANLSMRIDLKKTKNVSKDIQRLLQSDDEEELPIELDKK